ncbi:hypothetical protein F2P79_016328 [Pimephales promelas]|nr:hypothetical protein F2P79_016328 [Pimephales promelas]
MDYQLQQALICEFSDPESDQGFITAMDLKQGRLETPQTYNGRLRQAYFGGRNQQGMEEEVNFNVPAKSASHKLPLEGSPQHHKHFYRELRSFQASSGQHKRDGAHLKHQSKRSERFWKPAGNPKRDDPHHQEPQAQKTGHGTPLNMPLTSPSLIPHQTKPICPIRDGTDPEGAETGTQNTARQHHTTRLPFTSQSDSHHSRQLHSLSMTAQFPTTEIKVPKHQETLIQLSASTANHSRPALTTHRSPHQPITKTSG